MALAGFPFILEEFLLSGHDSKQASLNRPCSSGTSLASPHERLTSDSYSRQSACNVIPPSSLVSLSGSDPFMSPWASHSVKVVYVRKSPFEPERWRLSFRELYFLKAQLRSSQLLLYDGYLE